MSEDLVKQSPLWTEEQLADITSWDDLGELAKTGDTVVTSTADYGSGFSLIADREKGILVGVEFAIVQFAFHPGDYGQFVTLHVVTRDGRKLIINDGSSGICAQVERIAAKLPAGKRSIIHCPKGLTRSDYHYVDDKGEEKPATTFYLSLEK